MEQFDSSDVPAASQPLALTTVCPCSGQESSQYRQATYVTGLDRRHVHGAARYSGLLEKFEFQTGGVPSVCGWFIRHGLCELGKLLFDGRFVYAQQSSIAII